MKEFKNALRVQEDDIYHYFAVYPISLPKLSRAVCLNSSLSVFLCPRYHSELIIEVVSLRQTPKCIKIWLWQKRNQNGLLRTPSLHDASMAYLIWIVQNETTTSENASTEMLIGTSTYLRCFHPREQRLHDCLEASMRKLATKPPKFRAIFVLLVRF